MNGPHGPDHPRGAGSDLRFDGGREGGRAKAAARHFGLPAGSRQERDIRRFFHFSDCWVGGFPDEPLALGDLRYAALPNEIAPMWGIRLKPDDPEAAVEWISAAGFRQRPWVDLWRMIRADSL